MTCKNCYHYEACSGYSISDLDKDVWDYCAKGKTDEIPDIEDRCSEFKNKADVIEVVKCKDCIHSTLTFGTYICDNIQTPWFNDEFAIDVGANDFCSYGERKEGAEE